MKKIIQRILRFLARRVLAKYRPIIVGITGSVGKTTTKDAIAFVLSPQFRIRKSKGNYNNEIGVPLTILGEGSPGASFFGWLALVARAVRTLLFHDAEYPAVLVLEMAVDRIGDMKYLVKIAPPDVAVVTAISESHLEFFPSLEVIAQEKGTIVESLPRDGVALLNADDARVRAMKKRFSGKVIGYGFSDKADMRAMDGLPDEGGGEPPAFKVDYGGKVIPVRPKYTVGRHHLYAILAALSVADVFRMNFLEAARRAEIFLPPLGRLRKISGVRGSVILDDTYNASPASTRAAIAALGSVSAQRRVAILGDMLELGQAEESGHQSLAGALIKARVEYIVCVGRRMRLLADELIQKKYPKEKIFVCASPLEAAEHIAPRVRPGDAILVKGSQGMRMETVAEALLADPRDARFLVRQNKKWKQTSLQTV